MTLAVRKERGGIGPRRPLLWFFLATTLLASLLSPAAAHAHDPYETTTKVFVGSDSVDVTMIMARATAEALLGADNVPASGKPFDEDLPLDGLYVLSSNNRPLVLKSNEAAQKLDGEDEGDFVFQFEFVLPPDQQRVSLRAAYLQKLEQGYTGVVQVLETESSELMDMKVLHSSDPMLEFSTPAPALEAGAAASQVSASAQRPAAGRARPFAMFLGIGVEHVIFGYDHLLFLLGVLLACVGLRQVLGVLTTFTLAHSVTLSLAAFRILPLANDVVEPIIAASIAVAAFWGKALEARRLLLPVTFAFGLVHGLGFAAGLQSLADAGNVRLLGLVGFNLGVELGQIGAALALLPALQWCRKSLKGMAALDWTARAIGVVGATIFFWRVVG